MSVIIWLACLNKHKSTEARVSDLYSLTGPCSRILNDDLSHMTVKSVRRLPLNPCDKIACLCKIITYAAMALEAMRLVLPSWLMSNSV